MPDDAAEGAAGDGPDQDQDPVDAARRAIHDLFRQGYIDDTHATTALLAIDLGRHRVERAGGHHHEPVD